MRGRLFDLLLGAFVGVLVTGAASMYAVGSRVSALEVEVRFLRKDLDALVSARKTTLDSTVQEGAGNIAASIATGQSR